MITNVQVGMILFRRHQMTSVEITCKDKSYPWLLDWLASKGARETQHTSVETSYVETESGKVHTRYNYVPNPGTHIIRHQKTWIRVERTREMRMLEPWETIQMTALFKKKDVFNDILERARHLALSKLSGHTLMYVVRGTDWVQFGHPRQRRPLESVVLDQGVSDSIVADVREFIDSYDWYRARGIPYR